ncbi:MAG: TrmB family transcriptional regulator [Candidatus Woesearchaeota archaeon]
MNLEVLEKLGLTESEIKIYLEILKRETTKAGELIKKLELSSSVAYASLEKLIKKGLITHFEKNNVKYFQAQTPELLLTYLEEIKKEAKKTIEELKLLKKPEYKENTAAIFEGFNGYKQAFNILLNEIDETEPVYTIGFSPINYAFTTLRNILRKVDNKRIQKKVWMKIILPLETKKTIGKDREKEPYTEVKYLSKEHLSPASLSIFKDYVIHWVWSEENTTAFLIKNKHVSQSFKNHFEALWKLSE